MVSSQINMQKEIKVMIVSFITNVGLSLIKIIAGILGRSSALIADGVHSFSDLTTDVIAIFGNNLARKPADLKHPYGHGKSEYITSLIIGLLIILLGLGIINDLGFKEATTPNLFVLIIIVITIFVKLILSRYLIKKGNEYKNNILIASGKESSTDVISSIIVLISTLLSQLVRYNNIFKYSDKIAGIIIAIFIVKVGMDIVKENMSYVIGEQENNKEYIDELKEIIIKNKDININNLILLRYGPYFKLLAEIAMEGTITLKEAHDQIDQIENEIKNYDDKILYITIHMCPKE